MAHEDRNLLRILISTDNHLGVWEKDEIRKNDSFDTFEEVLKMAKTHNVDFLLLGGDLFHENKPSRYTIVKATQLLSKYCLGDDPIMFSIISKQDENFAAGMVNFEDPNINIGLPVLTIHGNHDDPSGQDNLSAVDMLSSCKLLNYFGKVQLSGSTIGKISLTPVLIQKGITRLALYGLGSVRDERLGRLFQTPGCVEWLRPAATAEHQLEEWLNVFVLHQNRVERGAAAKNCVQERHVPSFVDLVIWGHEHECRADPEVIQALDPNERVNSSFIVQPGSSVATALSEGEAKRKHVVLLEIRGEQWRVIKYPLETVRPFVWDQIVLRDQEGLDPEKPDNVSALLERKVADMMKAAAQQNPAPPPGVAPMLPLIRLRVDYTGFSTINSQRFGQKFVGKVANPHDMLLWAKAAQRKAKPEGAAGGDSAAGASGHDRPEALDQARIEDLITRNLQQDLKILPEEELAEALHSFVEKEEKNALTECIDKALKGTQDYLHSKSRPQDLESEEHITTVVEVHKQQRRAQRAVSAVVPSADGALDVPNLPPPSTGDGDGLEDEDDMPGGSMAAPGLPPRPARGGRGGGRRQAGIAESFGRGGSRGGSVAGTPSAGGPRQATLDGVLTGRSVARGGGRKRPASPTSEDDDLDDVIDSDEDGTMGTAPPAAKRRNTGSASRGRPSSARSAGRRVSYAGNEDDDDDDDSIMDSKDADEIINIDDESDDDIDDSPTTTQAKRGRGGRRGTSQATPASTQRSRRGGGRAGGRGKATAAPESVAPSQPPDESFIDSDDEGGRQPTAVASASRPRGGGGGRRLPTSLGSAPAGGSQRQGTQPTPSGPKRRGA